MKRIRLLIIFGVPALFWTCTHDNPVDSTGFSSGKLVFLMSDSTKGTPGTYTMNLDGSALKRIAGVGDSMRGWDGRYHIVPDRARFVLARWSPDGKRIACGYEAGIDASVLVVMDANGANKHVFQLNYGSAYRPKWSPEGDRILFMRGIYLGAIVAIGIIDATGGNDRDFSTFDFTTGEGVTSQVFEGDSVWTYVVGGDYQWGPTGNTIYGVAAIGKKPGRSYVLGSRDENEIFSFDSNTKSILKRLTRNQVDEGGFKLSPDGQYVAFVRGKYQESGFFHVLRLSDGNVQEISMPAYVNPVFWNWSSDSRKIVFAMDENPDPYGVDFHLYTIAIDPPSEIKRLTSFQAQDPDLFIP